MIYCQISYSIDLTELEAENPQLLIFSAHFCTDALLFINTVSIKGQIANVKYVVWGKKLNFWNFNINSYYLIIKAFTNLIIFTNTCHLWSHYNSSKLYS